MGGRLFADHSETKVYFKHRSPHRLWLAAFFIPLCFGFAGMSLVLVGLRLLPLPDGSVVNPTEIQSEDGLRLAEWTPVGTDAEAVPLARIPQALISATLAVEDTNFYRDHAIDMKSTARALLVNLKHGGVVQGGSTITQQLAKNLYLSQDRTVSRKVREALFAMQLELHKSKDWILGRYLNVVYYGHGAYGVQAASRLYFNKPVDALNLAECAMLAGLPKGPSIYSPLSHMDLAKSRQLVVLHRMVQAGYLTDAQASMAAKVPIRLATYHSPTVQAPYFTQVAVNEAKRDYGVTNEAMDAGDVRIRTTLDPLLQQAAERAVATTLPKQSHIQAAVVALDPKTGAIRALVGGRNFQTSPYNRVFAARQPGSTFKGILYTTALENGWTPANQVESKLTTFIYGVNQNKAYTVHDYGDIYAGRPLTLREALAKSDNVYAVHTNLAIGPERVVDMAHRMGIQEHLDPYPSLALGVFPVTPLEMAGAYAILANGGNKVTPYAVEDVQTASRDTSANPQTEQVISPAIAYQMTDLMRSVVEPNGTGYAVHQYLHNVVAAKTGTTDTDAWMVGYTPKLVVAVWVGYDTNRPLTVAEAHLASPIWAKLMGTAQSHMPYDWYQPTHDLKRVTLDPLTGQVATPLCRATEVDYFKPGTEPTDSCSLHSIAPPAQKARPLLPKPFAWLKKWF